jgi:signal transduction histidine kinase
VSTSTGPSAALDPRANAFARLFDTVHEGIYVGRLGTRQHQPDATVITNPHLRRMFRFPDGPDAELYPLAAARFVNPSDRAELIERLRTGDPVSDWRVRMWRVDSSEMAVEITARGAADAQGYVQVDALLRDVTEPVVPGGRSRQLEEQEAAHAQRLAALGFALSSVAHELNNPLASIIGLAESMAEAPLSDSARRTTPLILREAHRAARIVRNMLTLSRARPSTRTLADINQIIRETLALRAGEQRSLRINVIAALEPVLPAVLVDSHQIQQVLLNLLINAEHAMSHAHGRGSLVIRSSYDEARRRVDVSVSDDGPGLSQEVSGRIFDPFFTTKSSAEGTGLGLTVAHAIVRDHGGEIAAEASPTGGATFIVSLPVVDFARH